MEISLFDYELPPEHEQNVKQLVAAWTQAAKGPLALVPAPGLQSRMFTVFSVREPQGGGWRAVLPPETGQMVRARYGITAPAPAQGGS